MTADPKLDPDGVLHGIGGPMPTEIELPANPKLGDKLHFSGPAVIRCPTTYAEGTEPGVTARSKRKARTPS